jgi:hypothetical protein
MSYTQTAPAKSSRPAVDCENLVKIVARRCGECSDATYYETAKRFIEQQGYPRPVALKVMELLREYLMRRKTRRRADGGTICSTCRKPYEDHPADKTAPDIVRLCDGERVILI